MRYMIALALAGLATEASGAQITVDTTALQGQQGYLDFQFTSAAFTAQVNLLITGFSLFGGTLWVPQVTGDVSGSLDTTLSLSNALAFPPSEYFVPITFGTAIRLPWQFSGPGFTNPDGQFGPSTFTFSILDSTGVQPLLLFSDWPQTDPGGFAFVLELDSQGQASFQSFVAQDIGVTQSDAPEPATFAVVGIALLVLVRRTTSFTQPGEKP